jgi:NAD-dependent DNA ligase
MGSRERGATYVNVIWVVALVVLLIFAGGAVWVVNGALQKTEIERNSSNQEKDRLEQEKTAGRLEMLELSKLVGFKAQTAEVSSNQEELKKRIGKLRDALPNIGIPSDPSTATLEACVQKLEEAYQAQVKELDEKDKALKAAQSSRETAEQTLVTVQADKDKRIAEIDHSLSDEREHSANQKNADDAKVASLQAQVDEVQAKSRESETQMKTAEEKQKSELQLRDARLSELTGKLHVVREPDKPDGRIISVSDKGGLAYIDIGAKDMLRRGTRFQVFRNGKGGVPHRVGMVEVRDVMSDHSEVTIIDQVDPLDPIVKDDYVAAPYFDREMKKVFVFLGRFPSNYGKNFVKQRLEDIGAQVDEHVTPRTDILVVGEKETGENAPDLSESPDYKKAVEFGVQIMGVNDLLSYVKYN